MSEMDIWPLEGGPEVAVEAVQLWIELEDRGLRLIADGQTLRVTLGPDADRDKIGTVAGQLSAEDRSRITKWKFHLLLVIGYVPPTTC